MKIFRLFFSLIIAVLIFSTIAVSQSKLQPLAENASLEETQKWLAKAIKKFSPNDIYSFKFKGCSLKFDVARTSVSESRNYSSKTPAFVEGEFAYLSNAGYASDLPTNRFIYTQSLTYSFDFYEMDADKIILKSADKDKAQTIYINSTEGKNSVKYKFMRSYFGKPISQNYITFTVKEAVAEQIKAGFVQAIKLCQETN